MLEVRMYINVSLSIARFDCQGATTVEGGNPKGPTSVISTEAQEGLVLSSSSPKNWLELAIKPMTI